MHDHLGQFIPPSRQVSAAGVRLHPYILSFPTKAALKAWPADGRFEGMQAIVTVDGSRWVFSAASALADTTNNLVCPPDAGSGRWLRADRRVQLKLAVGFGTADAAALFTMPASGFRLALIRAFWEITTGFTGGTSSAIGLSSGQTGLSTKGDLLGGATGDVTATLGTAIGSIGGTIGAKFASNGQPVLEAAGTLRFDRVASVYTAGAGFVHVLADRID